MIWLRISGSPTRQFYANADARPHLEAGVARHERLTAVGTLRSGVDGETPNISVTLRNDDAGCAELFKRPPLGQQADLIDETGTRFSGVVKHIKLAGGACEIEVQA